MEDMFSVKGKVAIVTGASSGLGVQFAKALAERGAKLAILARRKDRLDSLAAEIKKQGGECLSIACDVGKEQDIINAVNAVKKHYGRIDILVNNSGIVNFQKAEKDTLEDWNKVININITGVYLAAREVGKIMIEQKYGKIINIGSIHSNTAISTDIHQLASYCTSKGGVQMLTKCLAAEWAQYNITVNTMAPAYFPSELTEEAIGQEHFKAFVTSRCPMKRTGRDKELNGSLIYFASDASSYTTGQTLNVDGGWNTI